MLQKVGLDTWSDGYYTIKAISGSYPESYDMLTLEGKIVAYFTVYLGYFKVKYPDFAGRLILNEKVEGDYILDDDERDTCIEKGYLAVIDEIGSEKQ